MSPTLVVVVPSALGIALFLYGVLLMSRRQEGGSARQPALLMIAGLAVVVLGMMSALVLTWTETSPDAPRLAVPDTGATPATAPQAPPAR